MFDQWGLPVLQFDYCLSETISEKCRLQFSFTIMVVVIFCNLVKATCMLTILLTHKTATLVTLGDAVSSFIDDPDPTTVGRCTMAKEKVIEWAKSQKPEKPVPQPAMPQARYNYSQTRGHYWFGAASVRRWLFCNIL